MDSNIQQTVDSEDGDLNSVGETPGEARMDAEFQYVIGHVTRRDVMVDGQVVVPAGTEVTAADAAGALAAGVLEDLAFAVGGGDPSKFEGHGRPDAVDETPDVPMDTASTDLDAPLGG